MKTLVSVIAYNEEQNLRNVLQDLRDNNSGFDLVVVDNGSLDQTVQVARKMGVTVLAHCVNSGGSMGTVRLTSLTLFSPGTRSSASLTGTGQHVAAELPKIIEPVRKGEADYVIGSRFIEKEEFQSTTLRLVGIRLFSWIDLRIVGQKVTDVTSGFRAYSGPVIEFFGHRFRYEIHDTNQLLLLSHFAGARILEVPVRMRERRHGQSEYDWVNAMAFPLKGLVNIVGALLQRHQIQKRR